MPKLNGFEFLKAIRESSRTEDLKRVAHTINYGLYISRNADIYLHHIEKKSLIPVKTNKDITKEKHVCDLIKTYELLTF
ncbi:MAG: hypothetical protein H7Y13_17660 [Sphingobacteriaceae bacterium]|nr:hypothetical protein [Sphingobacteriaceae bacterium]